MISSGVTLNTFNPKAVPYQYQVVQDIRKNFDYSKGVHEVLLSGSVGSAKSILMAHLALTHVLLYPKARFLLGRLAMPDLKDTILQKVLEHIGDSLVEGKHYEFNQTKSMFTFFNGSEIISRSWADRRYRKFRSLELSGAAVEELTENDSDQFEGFYKELRARVGRLQHVEENFIICATNPDSPAHSAYDYFIDTKVKTRKVYYSITSDNPYLPKWYIEGLKETYSERECQRMIYGKWIEITTDGIIYYSYDPTISTITQYDVNEYYPIVISFDFNIGEGKPMSCTVRQKIKGKLYYFDEAVIYGARTLDIMEELAARGMFEHRTHFVIRGDCNGRNRSTAYNKTDYDVITNFLANYRTKTGDYLMYDIDVPYSNPGVRERHIKVNGMLKNANGDTSVFILKDKCPMLDKGLRLTRLKKGGAYVENDNDPWQHVTTAFGYDIMKEIDQTSNRDSVKVHKFL